MEYEELRLAHEQVLEHAEAFWARDDHGERVVLLRRLALRMYPALASLARLCRLQDGSLNAVRESMASDTPLRVDAVQLLSLSESYGSELCQVFDPLLTGFSVGARALQLGTVEFVDLQHVLYGTLGCLHEASYPEFADALIVRFPGSPRMIGDALLREEVARLARIMGHPAVSVESAHAEFVEFESTSASPPPADGPWG